MAKPLPVISPGNPALISYSSGSAAENLETVTVKTAQETRTTGCSYTAYILRTPVLLRRHFLHLGPPVPLENFHPLLSSPMVAFVWDFAVADFARCSCVTAS